MKSAKEYLQETMPELNKSLERNLLRSIVADAMEKYAMEFAEELVKNCNAPAVSKCKGIECEALLRDYTDWLWLNHNILTNANNNETALKQYLSRNRY